MNAQVRQDVKRQIRELEAELVEVEALQWPNNVDSHVRLGQIHGAINALRERLHQADIAERVLKARSA